MTESNPILDKYMSLDQGERVQVLYVWIDGSGESMRCKTKTVEKEPVVPGDLPIWNFGGSNVIRLRAVTVTFTSIQSLYSETLSDEERIK